MASTPNTTELSVAGDSVFIADDTAAAAGVVVSADGKKVIGPTTTVLSRNVVMTVSTQGVRTVTVRTGINVAEQNLTDRGTLTVTGTGTGSQVVVSQGYKVVAGDDSPSAATPIALVHLLDANGAPLNLAGASVGVITQPVGAGTVTAATTGTSTLYVGGDCTARGLLRTGLDPQGTAIAGIVTPACATTLAASADDTNFGLWVNWIGATATSTSLPAVGNYTASFNLTLAGAVYPVSVNYTVSTSGAAATTGVSFDKETYQPGERVVVTTSFVDVNGLPVADGYGKDDSTARLFSPTTTVANAPITDPASGAPIAPRAAFTNGAAGTYGGVATGAFLAPDASMDTFRYTLGLGAATNFVLSSIANTASSDTARIGNPVPPAQESIMIEGTRGVGDDANRVYVEGTTVNLVGKTVTPYFRFPGETGFTAGTGTRTVDAQGNFAWQRKTGKKIAIQFRAGDGVVSNTIIIEAK